MVSYGTNDSIERLVETYSGMLLRLAASRLKNTMDAEDAVQEVFLYLIEHQVTFRNAAHEKAWLIRATLHRTSDIRRRAYHGDLPLEEVGERGEDPPGESLLEELRSMPEEYAAVLYLFYYEGYSIREIASLLNLSQSAVGVRLHRGRNLLRNIIKEDLT